MRDPAADRACLESLYARYNRREYVSPDPLQFVLAYADPGDREIAGLVASSLAYGRVAMILRNVAFVLERLPSPARDLRDATRDGLRRRLRGLKHRWTTGAQMAALLWGAREVVRAHGSLGAFVRGAAGAQDGTILPALCALVRRIVAAGGRGAASLLPDPGNGSACKRLLMYARWMVRRDAVDPGGWDGVDPALLVVPMDTHMHRICRSMRLTRRRTADLRAALEATGRFRLLVPSDPVRYDFPLTRLGIRSDADPGPFLGEWMRIRGRGRRGGEDGDCRRGAGARFHAGRDEGEGDPIVVQGKEGRGPVLLPAGVHPRLKQGTARL